MSKPSDQGAVALVQEHALDPWHFWLLGELFGYRGHRSNTALDAFVVETKAGNESPSELNGHFALFGFNADTDQWHVWTNRLGTVHVYHASNGARASVGTFYPAVVASSNQRFDWTALSGYAAFGFFPADRTFYDDVKILRPATHTVLGAQGQVAQSAKYWSWPESPDRSRTYRDTVASFGDTLSTVMRDHAAAGRMVLPISGGLDSRTLAAVLAPGSDQNNGSHGNGLSQPWTYSYGYTPDSQEISIAARVARSRGLDFESFVIPEYVFQSFERILASVEGFQSVTSTRQAAVLDTIAPHGDYLLAGHWGDVWMNDAGLPPTERPAGDDVLVAHARKKIDKRGGEWLIQQMCVPQLAGQSAAEVLRQIVADELRRLEYVGDPDSRLKAFKTEQWSFRWTIPSLRMFQPTMAVRLPFYDNRMVDFCTSVPPEFLRDRRLQLDYLKTFHRDLARITWDVTDSSLFYAQYYDSWLLPKRVAKKLVRVALRKQHIGRNWMGQFLTPTGRAGLDNWLLRPGRRIHEFVNRRAVVELVEGLFRSPDAANGYAVSQLLTLSGWMERYG